MKPNKELAAIKLLLTRIKKGFGKPCREPSIECGNCMAWQLHAHLEWYGELLVYPDKLSKKEHDYYMSLPDKS